MLEVDSISVKEIRNYFQQYRCEILTADEKNRLLIQNFKANKFGNSLERYLKEMAWLEIVLLFGKNFRMYIRKEERFQG